MSNTEYEQIEFDDTDLISGQSANQVPQQKPIDSVTEILQQLISKDSIYPNGYYRNLKMNIV